MKWALVLCTLFLGCAGGTKPPPMPAAGHRVSGPAPHRARASAAATETACELKGKSISYIAPCAKDEFCSWEFQLWTAPGESAFARILDVHRYMAGAAISVGIPVGDAKKAARVEVKGEGVTLTGHVVRQIDGFLFARKPTRLGPAVVAKPSARLRWYRGLRGGVVVGSHKVKYFTSRTPLRRTIKCEGLSLDDDWTEDQEAKIKKMFGVGAVQRKVLLRGAEVPLYTADKQQRAGTLKVGLPGPYKVELIKQTARRSLVYIDHRHHAIFGWIPNSGVFDLSGDLNKQGSGIASIFGRDSAIAAKLKGSSCHSAKDLYVKYRHRYRKVGSFKKGVHFLIKGRKSDWTRVELEGVTWFQPAKNFFLYVKTGALADCSREPSAR